MYTLIHTLIKINQTRCMLISELYLDLLAVDTSKISLNAKLS